MTTVSPAAKRMKFIERLDEIYSQDEFHSQWTPIELADEMVSKIQSDWSGKIAVFYCMSLWRSVFLKVRELRGAEHAAKNITFFVSDDQKSEWVRMQSKHLSGIESAVINIPSENVNEWIKDNNNMKFDVVVGNPPYQETKNGKSSKASKRLWEMFVDKILNLTTDGAIVALITPATWVSNTSVTNKLLREYNFNYISLASSITAAFAGTGGSARFSMYVFKREKAIASPNIIFDDGIFNVDIFNMPFVPVKSSLGCDYSICQKMIKSNIPALQWIRREKTGRVGDIEVSIPRAKSPTWQISTHEDGSGFGYIFSAPNLELAEIVAHNLNLKIYQLLRWILRSGMALVSSITLIPIPIDKKYDNESIMQLFAFSDIEKKRIMSFGE